MNDMHGKKLESMGNGFWFRVEPWSGMARPWRAVVYREDGSGGVKWVADTGGCTSPFRAGQAAGKIVAAVRRRGITAALTGAED